MLTQHAAVKSITDAPTLSPHKQQPASRTPHPESTTSNATRTQPHTATAETSHTMSIIAAQEPDGEIALGLQLKHAARRALANRTTLAYGKTDARWAKEFDN